MKIRVIILIVFIESEREDIALKYQFLALCSFNLVLFNNKKLGNMKLTVWPIFILHNITEINFNILRN